MGGQRLTRVERVMQRLNEDPLAKIPRQGVDFWSLNGVKQQDHWTPPAPHRGGMVSFGGGNPHTDLIPRADTRTTAQVIADMIAGK